MNNQNFILTIDKFNSEIFNKKMGNLQICENLDIKKINNIDKQINEILEEAINDGFEHITCKVDTNHTQLVQSLENNKMLLADTLITYRFYYGKSKLYNVNHQCLLNDCKKEDLDYLKSISKNAFKIDRFHSDPSLDNNLCDKYYEKWIENSFNGFADRVIVAYLDEEPVGYTTAKIPGKDRVGHLVLSAVSEKSRGKGVYTSMIYEGVKWMEGKAECLQVGTQINNIAVQKAWIKLGFTVGDSFYVFQKSI